MQLQFHTITISSRRIQYYEKKKQQKKTKTKTKTKSYRRVKT